jgi:hypothetical protein
VRTAGDDHRLANTPACVFIDESGPNYDPGKRNVVLGCLVCPASSASSLLTRLDSLAAALEQEFPSMRRREWKGSFLGRRVTRAQRRKVHAAGGQVMTEGERAACYARALQAATSVHGVQALLVTAEWRSPTPKSWGPDYRLREATLELLAALERRGVDAVHAVIDQGHDEGYSAAFEEYSQVYGGRVPGFDFHDSRTDRRLQVADLLAHLGRAHRFPTNQHLRGIGTWLDAPFLRAALLKDGGNPDHHQVRP